MRKPEKRSVTYYGSRKSDKFVRCYEKDELGVYRVEIELHAHILRRHNIAMIEDFIFLPELIYPRHLRFVDVDWNHLEHYLKRKIGRRTKAVIAAARKRETSIQRLQRYLRSKAVLNPHRFLVSVPLNKEVSRALDRWVRHFN